MRNSQITAIGSGVNILVGSVDYKDKFIFTFSSVLMTVTADSNCFVSLERIWWSLFWKQNQTEQKDKSAKVSKQFSEFSCRS